MIGMLAKSAWAKEHSDCRRESARVTLKLDHASRSKIHNQEPNGWRATILVKMARKLEGE